MPFHLPWPDFLPSLWEISLRLTHFGAILLLAPLCVLLALWLWRAAGWRAALLYGGCVAGTGLTIAIGKVFFSGCHARLWDVHSPSGHTAASAIAYGGFTAIAMAGSRSVRAQLFRVGTLLWIAVIGLTRVKLMAHTFHEVVVGWIVGGTFLAVFVVFYRGRVRPPYLLAGLLMVAVVAVGWMLPVNRYALEGWLGVLGHWFAPMLPCQWLR